MAIANCNVPPKFVWIAYFVAGVAVGCERTNIESYSFGNPLRFACRFERMVTVPLCTISSKEVFRNRSFASESGFLEVSSRLLAGAASRACGRECHAFRGHEEAGTSPRRLVPRFHTCDNLLL